MPTFEEGFNTACESGMLPGVALLAADKSGTPFPTSDTNYQVVY